MDWLIQLLGLLSSYALFGIAGYLIALILARRLRQSHKNLEEAIENLSEGFYTASIDGHIISANRAMREMNGCQNDPDPVKTIHGAEEFLYVEPGRRQVFLNLLRENGRVDNFISEMRRVRTGEHFWALENARVVKDPKTGTSNYYQGTVTDISETIKRRNVEQRLEILANTIPGGLFQLRKDADGTFAAEYVSNGFLSVLDMDSELAGDPNNYLSLIHEEDLASYLNSLNNSEQTLCDWNVAFRITSKGGSARWLQVIAKPLKNADGSITWHGYLSDVTANKEAEAQIEKFAFYDALTNLPNRRLLGDRLVRAARLAARHRNHGALLFIDMDNFKIINDIQGHEIGDKFLKEVSNRLVTCVRSSDTVSRFGGDEFLIVLNDLPAKEKSAEEHAILVAEKVLSALLQGFTIDGVHQIASCSIGIRMFDGSEIDADHLIKCADIAMYRAKAEGRNKYSVFHEDRLTELSERYSLQSDLRAAIDENQFYLLYQPLIGAQGQITGAEALVRWNHPKFGLVMPNEFIPGAEESGQIVPISSWIIEKALATLAEWSADPYLSGLQVSVNMSALQFKDRNFVPSLTSQMAARNIKPGRLKLELTERVLADDPQFVFEQMTQLRDIGIRFSLDDFGTGFSCLSQLKQYAFDELKIDGSFVSDIENNASTRALIEAILAMADALGMTTVAERVETELQRDFLLNAGCRQFQGYFYAKPMAEKDLLLFCTQNAEEQRQITVQPKAVMGMA